MGGVPLTCAPWELNLQESQLAFWSAAMTPTSSHCKVQVCVSVHGIDDTAASAACRGLGHPYGRVADPSNVFRPGNGAVALSDLKCPPGAASLNSCDYSLGAWENPGITWRLTVPCLHAQDLSIECFDHPPGALTGFLHWHAAGWEETHQHALYSCPPAEPVTGIRLINGTASSGRLEVQAEGYGWRTVR